MFKSLVYILLLSASFNSVTAQQETAKTNYDSLSFREKVNSFFFNEHPPKVYTKPSPKKNTIYFQALGDTPWVGVGYSRRLFEHVTYLIETGVGVGWTPVLFNTHVPKPKEVSFSHHTRVVFRPQKLVSPTLAYSGVWFSGEFHQEKIYNYWPSPSLGVRLGNSNSFAINLNWCGYFYKEDFLRLNGQDIVERGYKSKLLGLPSANFQISF